MLNRREFSRYFLAGGTALLTSGRFWPAANPPVFAAQRERSLNQDCDLLIKGGTVIDPGQQLHAPLDVAVKDGKILEISRDFPEGRALQVVSAKDKIVTPGFIDLHIHCYDGVGSCINADHYCLTKGVTTVVDGGSSGHSMIANFHKYIINTSITRIKALVDICALAQVVGPRGRMNNLEWVDPLLTAKAAENNKPAVVGIKVKLGKELQGANDLEVLKRALQAAETAHIPLMAHIDGTYSPLPDILVKLRKGDVYTHFLNSHPHGILDASGKILSVVREARARGVVFDIAQGRSHLSFDVMGKCLEQDFPPDTISTDLTLGTMADRVYDLPTMVSKFVAIGVDLDKAIQMVTIHPARVFDYGLQIGTLRPGNEADIGIFELREGKFEFEDSDGKKITGRQKLFSKAVVRHGQLFINEI